MVDSIGEKHLENSTNKQLENPADKIIPNTNTETIKLTQDIENMEVHKHPHYKTRKKKWGKYLLEFLLLFLAVFLGFLAENIREDKVEGESEKMYMYSMLEDLKSDATQLSIFSQSRIKRVEMIDSLIFLLSSADYSANLNDIYFFGRSLSLNIDFFPNDRTILQLKNSGALRLVHNAIVSNSIMNYDQKMRSLVFLLTQEQQQRIEYRKIASAVFNGTVFNSMIHNYDVIKKPINNPALFNSGATAINELINNAQYLKKVDMNQIKKARELTSLTVDLISLIKKEYDLE